MEIIMPGRQYFYIEMAPMAYFTKELNPSLAKSPLKFYGNLAKLSQLP